MKFQVTPTELYLPRVRSVLSNGLTLIVSRREGAPITASRLMMRGGSSLDPAGQEGLAWLVGQLADQGTNQHDEAQLATRLEPCGGSLAGNQAGLSGSVAGDHWKVLLETLLEVACHPAYPNDPVRRQQQRFQARLRVAQENPQAQAAQRFLRLIYGKHWLGRPSHGTVETIGALDPKDLLAHHRNNWGPDRAILSICGDVDPAAVKRLVQRLTSGWEGVGPVNMTKPRFPKGGNRLDAFRKSRDQVHLFLGHLGVRRSNPDWATLVVMDHILGSGPGFTARITKRLRDEQGLAYSVYADIHSSAGRLPGRFRAYIGTSPQHVYTAVGGFLEEMRRIQNETVSMAELDLARDYLVGSFPLGFERASQRASYLVSAEVHGHADDHLAVLPRVFASVTAKMVRDVARKYLQPDHCCLSASGPVTRRELTRALAQ
ncbi:MAG TPA: insulinase family protein [Planctomycetes bacterium]|nr:insulinase family protein [Planctomycetota bacterium]HIL37458.1 insulinase family protein [Planctomycetota bacterium]